MRITRDLLHKFARETVKQRQRSEPDLHSVYLMGSMLTDHPLLGGTTDIDLVLVHKYLAPAQRETLALTPEISLDIFHKTQEDYQNLRQFRKDPWMGYPLTFNHILLYDTDHWLEFAQSSVTAEFHRSDNVLARVNTFLAAARNRWRTLTTPPQTHMVWLDRYLEALALAANAIAGLNGPPLATRRFMISLTQRLSALGIPEVGLGLRGLLGCSAAQDLPYERWIDAFEQDLIHLTESTTPPPSLSPCRHVYYVDGFRALAKGEDPTNVVWPLLRTWIDVQLALTKTSPGSKIWHEAIEMLTLTEVVVDEKVDALDAYLDNLEVLIESWSTAYGF